MIFESLRIVLTWGTFALLAYEGHVLEVIVFWIGCHVMKMKSYELERHNRDKVFTMETTEIEVSCSSCGRPINNTSTGSEPPFPS